MNWHADTAAVAAVLCGAGALLVPAIVRWVPEPAEEIEGKEPYTAIAALPGLAWRSALAGAVAGGLMGAAYGWIWPLLVVLPLVPVSIALAVIDWRTRLLPTALIRPMAVAVVVLVVASAVLTSDWGGLVRAAVGCVVSGGLFFLLWWIHPRGLGFGDVRLAGVLGLALGYLGMGPLLVGVYAGFLLGGVGGGLLSLLRIVQRRAFPFGPFMFVGAVLGVVWGGVVLDRLVGTGA